MRDNSSSSSVVNMPPRRGGHDLVLAKRPGADLAKVPTMPVDGRRGLGAILDEGKVMRVGDSRNLTCRTGQRRDGPAGSLGCVGNHSLDGRMEFPLSR